MRAHFDLDPDLIYLNSGTHSIVPRMVLKSMMRIQAEFELNPTAGVFGAWERLWKVQTRLAGFLNARPIDLFLRPNVTEALNAFILGFDDPKLLPTGSEILVSELEYGAIVNLCRFRAERDGLTLRSFPLPDSLPDSAGVAGGADRLAEYVLQQLRPETKMLVLSHIMTGNGLILPIREIARKTRERGVLLVIDGAHGPGALPLDFSQLDDVDFYGGNLHKWMMGPKGSSFGWVPERHHDRIRPIQAGWTTFEYPAPFVPFGQGNSFQARMLSSACRDFAPLFAIPTVLEFWEQIGAEAIRARISALQLFVEREIVSATGWRRASPDLEMRGPLVAFELPERLEKRGFELMKTLLQEHRIQVVTPPLRGRFHLRLSPHVYNTEDEISRTAKVLSQL